MQKIIDVVSDIFTYDDDAKNAIDNGIFSINKYARKITPAVSKILMKPVSPKTIAVSVYRLSKQFSQTHTISPIFSLLSISLHPNLAEITYERTKDSLQTLAIMGTVIPLVHDSFYTQTSSISEVTIIIDETIFDQVVEHMAVTPRFQLKHLSGITVRFDSQYIGQPRLIYELTKRLSMNDINIIEVVSTASELTYIVDRFNAEKTVTLLSKFTRTS